MKPLPEAVQSLRLRLGATLVELLVVIVLVVLVCGVALTLYQLAARHSVQQQAVIEQTQNLRAALYTVARDVRMAGNGMRFMGNHIVQIYVDPSLVDYDIQEDSGWFIYKGATAYGVRPVFGQNGGIDGPDSLTIFSSEVERSAPLGQLGADYNPGSDDKIILRDLPIVDGTLTAGDMLAITWNATTVIIQAGSFVPSSGEIRIGPRYKPQEPLPGSLSIPEGAEVYNLRDVTFVTYYVDTAENRLMASYMDASIGADDYDDALRHSVIVANDIEDFQVGYYLNPDGSDTVTALNGITEGNLSGRWVRGVALSLVSRSPLKNEASGEGEPIKVMDHTDVGSADGHSRRIMTENINLRNF